MKSSGILGLLVLTLLGALASVGPLMSSAATTTSPVVLANTYPPGITTFPDNSEIAIVIPLNTVGTLQNTSYAGVNAVLTNYATALITVSYQGQTNTINTPSILNLFSQNNEPGGVYYVVGSNGNTSLVIVLTNGLGTSAEISLGQLGTLINENVLPQGTYYTINTASSSEVVLTSSSTVYGYNLGQYYTTNNYQLPVGASISITPTVYNQNQNEYVQYAPLTLTVPQNEFIVYYIYNPAYLNLGNMQNLVTGRQVAEAYVIDTQYGTPAFNFTLIYGSPIQVTNTFEVVNDSVVLYKHVGTMYTVIIQYIPGVNNLKIDYNNGVTAGTFNNVTLVTQNSVQKTQYKIDNYTPGGFLYVVLPNSSVDILTYDPLYGAYVIVTPTAPSYTGSQALFYGLIGSYNGNMSGVLPVFPVSETSSIENGSTLKAISTVHAVTNSASIKNVSVAGVAKVFEEWFNVTPAANVILSLTVKDPLTFNPQTANYGSQNVSFMNGYVYIQNITNPEAQGKGYYYTVNVSLNITPTQKYLFNKIADIVWINATYQFNAGSTQPYFMANAITIAPVMNGKANYMPPYASTYTTTKAFPSNTLGQEVTTTNVYGISFNVPAALGYIALVNFGLWNNNTQVDVIAHTYSAGKVQNSSITSGTPVFYPRVEGPRFSSYIPVMSTIIGKADTSCEYFPIVINAPSTVLVPGSLSNTTPPIYPYINRPTVNGPFDQEPSAGATISLMINSKTKTSLTLSTLQPEVMYNPATQQFYNSSTIMIPVVYRLGNSDQLTLVPNATSPIGYTVQIVLSPHDLKSAVVNVTYVDSDYAVHYYLPFSDNISALLKFNVTGPVLQMPAVAYLTQSVIQGYISSYLYASPYPAQVMGISAIGGGNTNVTLYLPNNYDFQVGNLTKVFLTFPNGTVKSIYLSSSNLSTLLVSTTLPQVGICEGNYSLQISILGLAKIFNVTPAALNGSKLTVSYYDIASNKKVNATTLLLLGNISQIKSPQNIYIQMFPTEKFVAIQPNVSANTLIPISAMIQVPKVYVLDKNLQGTSSVLILSQFTITGNDMYNNVTITANYNGTYTNVTVKVGNSMKSYIIPGYVGSLTQTGVNTANYSGSVLPLYVPEGNIQNPDTPLYLMLPNGSMIDLVPSQYLATTNFTGLVLYSNYTATYLDPVTHLTFPVSGKILPAPFAPIRITLANYPASKLATSNLTNYGLYNKTIDFTAVNHVVLLNVTSIFTYPEQFYIYDFIYAGSISQSGINNEGGLVKALPIITTEANTLPPVIISQNSNQSYYVVQDVFNLAGLAPNTNYFVQLVAEGYADGVPISQEPTYLYFNIYYA